MVFIGKRKSAICAMAYHGLVRVDKDSGMTKRTATPVAWYHSIMSPSNRLLMDKVDSSIRQWLVFHNGLFESWTRHSSRPRILTPRPSLLPVRSLHSSNFFCFLHRLYQALRLEGVIDGHFVCLGNVRDFLWFIGHVEFLVFVGGKGICAFAERLDSGGEQTCCLRSGGE